MHGRELIRDAVDGKRDVSVRHLMTTEHILQDGFAYGKDGKISSCQKEERDDTCDAS